MIEQLTAVLSRIGKDFGHWDDEILSIMAIVFFLGSVLFQYFWRKRRASGHRRKVREAAQVLRRLREMTHPVGQFHLLRSTDPYVFEEMILTALKHFGHKITRNKRYSGDGGIDGKCVIDGEKVLIQAKRYKNHICSQHVKHFADICRQRRCKGLFVHTGKTGRGSRIIDAAAAHLEIVSGARMLELLTLKQFRVNFV